MPQSGPACKTCGAAAPAGVRFCGACGAALAVHEAVTVTSAAAVTPSAALVGSSARFLPGQMLANRYRMVGLLGSGGMGEVYRADDLKLGQPVALKFLPPSVAADPARLDRFLNEVRLSLRVTHPNVCRVFDIGDASLPGAEGHFLSMEYVDGEDLASLLRRIGRLPEDKAIEIARQLCAGLQAAHDEGVLHRDLKPANVMIDGRGRAKITDFGLAGGTAGIAGREARAGTPEYMAPEQFEGGELSVRTDVYSLGLVLYELFTGKRAFDSHDILELARMRSSTPANPGAHVSGLNPAIEQTILRCLDPDPAGRPRSAAAVAAALPGSDPLAMALAAGETPSPELIARAGGRGELRLPVAATCLMLALAGLGGIWYIEGRTSLVNRVPLPKPPAELRVAARAALAAAGYADGPISIAYGFQQDQEYFHRTERERPGADRWSDLPTLNPAPIWFWYREAARPMWPTGDIGRVNPGNPPITAAGMKLIRLDPSGRLQELLAVPGDRPAADDPFGEPDWSPLFTAAGLNLREWTPVDPIWAPPRASDVRRAWTRGDLRIEAASFRGRPVWFRVVPPWRRGATALAAPVPGATGRLVTNVLMLVVTLAGAVFARRNLRLGRGDTRGATRMAGGYLLLSIGYHALRLPSDPVTWPLVLRNNVAMEVFYTACIWLFYIAVEPYVRRLWPHTLITWTRLVAGQFRDPLVGRHVLLGSLAGLALSGMFLLPRLLLPLVGLGVPDEHRHVYDGLGVTGEFAAQFLDAARTSFFVPVTMLLVITLSRAILGRPLVAYAVLLALAAGFAVTNAPLVIAAAAVGTVAFSIWTLARLGLLALVLAHAFSSWGVFYLTTDPSSWYFSRSVVTMMVFGAIAAYGFRVSLGGQKIFTDAVLEPATR